LAVLANAELRFFNVNVVHPHVVPTNAEKVIEVATKTRADGLTAPAVAIKDLYTKRKVVKFIVVVTDEVENEPHQGDFFAQLFYRYYSEVYPAKLVFVSFLDDMSKKGRMVQALESFGIAPLQFRLDATRPDLTKVDSLLGILASETEHFSTLSHTLASLLDDGADLRDVVHKLRAGFGRAGDGAAAGVPAAAAASSSSAGDVPSAAATSAAAGELDAKAEAKAKRSPFECPITLATMSDPVVCADGQTYEREAIQAWLDAGKTTSPLTGAPLEHHLLVSNYALRTMILEKAQKKKQKEEKKA
jgi:U-box domain